MTAALLPPATPSLHWFGIDLRWAYAELLSALRRQCGCPQRAKDVLHDALLRYALLQHRSQVTEPQAYLRRVAQSVLSDQLRRDQHYVFEAEPDEQRLPAAPDTADLAALRQRLALLQQVIDTLPPRCREVFWRVRVEGDSQPHVAAALGISLNMVERHLIRAMLDLRALQEQGA
ncbi:RNA polymerase sigma factor [Vogesella urethralis]|uniref:RNA polymerase sigma factor n=1 Tax=Vogesella urethralis TaxID=2592656 RepID=UPI001186D986|nr:sigma-70 family RNA polymerase sigma factor [Vogesella urethralis]